MEQSYRDKLRKHLKASEDEWWQRRLSCSRRILGGVLFRESSQSVYEKTENCLLPPIGFYYSLFHMGVAMLHFDHSTSQSGLRHVGHDKLEGLIKSKLIQTKLIPASYLDMLQLLRKQREFANYVLGGTGLPDYDFYFKKIVPNLYDETGRAFDFATAFILEVAEELEKTLEMVAPIQISIGDGIGDDIYSMYLSDGDERRVVEYLVSKNLTT